jgi:hypothetical protein
VVSDAVSDTDYPITRVLSTEPITLDMVGAAYTAAARSTDNPDVPSHLSDQQLQVFMRSLAGSLAEAERIAAVASNDHQANAVERDL